jgi:carbon storage regulator
MIFLAQCKYQPVGIIFAAILPRRNIMLVLSRRVGEEIVIEENIRLTIMEVKGGCVRVGIAAPPSVTVNRKEVHDRRVESPARFSCPSNA